MASLRGWASFRLGLVVAVSIGSLASCSSGGRKQSALPPYVTSGQFTTEHPNMTAVLKDYFDVYPTHVPQPIAFTHKVHLAHGMQCEDCHKGASNGPDATIPNVQLCMTCHQVIATDNPEIKKVAAYQKEGDQIPWRRVNWFYQSAHVKFQHAPHLRAGISCSACHGDMRQQTTAVRKAGLYMGFCLNCHRTHNAPTDCMTCHY